MSSKSFRPLPLILSMTTSKSRSVGERMRQGYRSAAPGRQLKPPPRSTTKAPGLAQSQWNPKIRWNWTWGGSWQRLILDENSRDVQWQFRRIFFPCLVPEEQFFRSLLGVLTQTGLSSAGTHRDSRTPLSPKRTGARVTSASLVLGHMTELSPLTVCRSIISLIRSSFVSIS